MLHNKILAHSILASFAFLAFNQVPKASALPSNWVQRGPHGAIQIVESDHLPIGSTALPTAPSHRFPQLLVRGSHGAAQITDETKMADKMSEGQPSGGASKAKMMNFQSESEPKTSTYQSTNRRNVEELLEITNPLI